MATLLSPYSNCILFMSYAFARAMAKVAEPYFVEAGLTLTGGFLLMSVVREPGITSGALAKEVLLDPSTGTRALDKMEAKGLWYKDVTGNKVTASPAVQGRRIEKDARAVWGKVQLYYQSKFTPEKGDQWAIELDGALAWMQHYPD